MSKQTILVVEDENNISSFISAILSANGYNVIKATSGKDACTMISSHLPDAVLLDLGLPDIDGTEVIKFVRGWSNIPVIVISARDHENDKVYALDLGADDYITKPFGTSELLARIRTALRHRNLNVNNEFMQSIAFRAGDLQIDFDKRHVKVRGEEVHLTQIEFKIVELLCKYSGKVLTYDYILKNIWGPHAGSDNRILRVNMANIRRKLEVNPAEPQYFFTETGVGYRMVEGD